MIKISGFIFVNLRIRKNKILLGKRKKIIVNKERYLNHELKIFGILLSENISREGVTISNILQLLFVLIKIIPIGEETTIISNVYLSEPP